MLRAGHSDYELQAEEVISLLERYTLLKARPAGSFPRAIRVGHRCRDDDRNKVDTNCIATFKLNGTVTVHGYQRRGSPRTISRRQAEGLDVFLRRVALTILDEVIQYDESPDA